MLQDELGQMLIRGGVGAAMEAVIKGESGVSKPEQLRVRQAIS